MFRSNTAPKYAQIETTHVEHADPIVDSTSHSLSAASESEWRVTEDGTLQKFVRRDSVSLTSENEMHANEEEHEIIVLDLSSIPDVQLKPPPVVSTLWSRWKGFVFLAVSAFFFSLMSLFVSMTGGRINSFLLVWIRCISQFSLAVGAIVIQRLTGNVSREDSWFVTIMGPKGKKRFLFARGFVGIFSLSCFYYALTTLHLSDATVLFFTAPIYTGIIGKVVLNEQYDLIDGASCAASFIGVILVSRPAFLFGSNPDDGELASSSGQRTLGVVVALVGAFISAWVYIFIRRVGKGVNPFILVHYLGLIGLVGAPFSLVFGAKWILPAGSDMGYIVGICIFAFAGQFLFNKGGAQTSAGVSALIRNLDIVCSFFWQITVQGVPVNGWSFLGACIVTGSVVALGVRKWRKEKAKVQAERLEQEKAAEQDESLELSKLPEHSNSDSDEELDIGEDPLVDDLNEPSDAPVSKA